MQVDKKLNNAFFYSKNVTMKSNKVKALVMRNRLRELNSRTYFFQCDSQNG